MKCHCLTLSVLAMFVAGAALFPVVGLAGETCPQGGHYLSAKASEQRVIYDADDEVKIGLRNIGKKTVFVQLNRGVLVFNDLRPRQSGMYETDYLLVRGKNGGLIEGIWEICVTIAP